MTQWEQKMTNTLKRMKKSDTCWEEGKKKKKTAKMNHQSSIIKRSTILLSRETQTKINVLISQEKDTRSRKEILGVTIYIEC